MGRRNETEHSSYTQPLLDGLEAPKPEETELANGLVRVKKQSRGKSFLSGHLASSRVGARYLRSTCPLSIRPNETLSSRNGGVFASTKPTVSDILSLNV